MIVRGIVYDLHTGVILRNFGCAPRDQHLQARAGEGMILTDVDAAGHWVDGGVLRECKSMPVRASATEVAVGELVTFDNIPDDTEIDCDGYRGVVSGRYAWTPDFHGEVPVMFTRVGYLQLIIRINVRKEASQP